ncbi:MAG: class I SAM-dependent methyltransferase [Ignavibacteriales bacterium]|nr:class I SAM-dependent methyltransferase [Ignavibacteriales bacterium]
MNNKIKVELGDIQKTLFMPVWARAVEAKKSKQIFIDKAAVEIIDLVDYDFSRMSKNVSEISQIAWIARCKRFDSVIENFIKNHPNGTIVNIGCGLDTTYERLNNKSILWYDLDLPDVIDLRKKFMMENENRQFISCSFLDTKWFNKIVIPDKVLFIATGVFVYFEEGEIKNFIVKLADKFDNSEIIFDVTSPKGVHIANQVIHKSGLDSKSFFKWGLKNKSIITSWDKRISILNTFYTFKIKGLGLSFRNKLMGLLSDSLDVQYMLHLSISKT